MTLNVISAANTATDTRVKTTCLTCHLKKCVGRCHWAKEPARRAA